MSSLFGPPNQYGAFQEPPSQKNSDTSRAAAEAIKPGLTLLQIAVLGYLRKCGEHGATDEEMQEDIPLTASTQRPRRCELCANGQVRDSGKTRPTRSGRRATVWIATA